MTNSRKTDTNLLHERFTDSWLLWIEWILCWPLFKMCTFWTSMLQEQCKIILAFLPFIFCKVKETVGKNQLLWARESTCCFPDFCFKPRELFPCFGSMPWKANLNNLFIFLQSMLLIFLYIAIKCFSCMLRLIFYYLKHLYSSPSCTKLWQLTTKTDPTMIILLTR